MKSKYIFNRYSLKKIGFLHFAELIALNFRELVLLNLLFILTSVPVITLGASACAVSKVAFLMIEDTPIKVSKEYFKYFKKYLKAGVVMEIFSAVLTFIIAISFNFYYKQIPINKIFYLPAAVSLSSAVIFVILLCYIINIYVNIELKPKYVIKNALIFSLASLKNNVILLMFIILNIFVVFILLPYSVILLLIILFSFYNFTIAYITYKPIKELAFLR